LTDRTTIVSFETEALTPIANADVRIGLVGSVPSPTLLDEARRLDVDLVLAHYVPRLTPAFNDRVRRAGFEVGIWSLVDTTQSLRDAIESDPDVLTVNRPDLVATILSKQE
jgi:hypothetical protein